MAIMNYGIRDKMVRQKASRLGVGIGLDFRVTV